MKGRLDSHRVRLVLYEGPGSQRLDDTERGAVLAALLEAGHSVTRPAAGGTVAPSDDSEPVVLGRFGGTPPVTTGALRFVDLTGHAAAEVPALVEGELQRLGADVPGGWKPWFPVIDYDRCTNCMQCLTFCLFDVYGVDAGKRIEVQNQDNCKTDCPACSRVCPEAAILFPKYAKGPINGDVVREQDLQREAMKADVSALLGGDIYAALRERSAGARKRFSTERDESKALLERKRCLQKMQQAFDIPDEVLMTLPSAGDIEERARRAREKAEKRRQRSQTLRDARPTATEEDWGI